MKSIGIILLLCFISLGSFGQAKGLCKCEGNKKINYKDRLIVCGEKAIQDDYIVDTNVIINLVINDCKGDSAISYQSLTDDGDEYLVKDSGDSLIIERVVELYNDDMSGLDAYPISYMVLKVKPNGAIFKSDFRYCFTPPRLSVLQNDSIKKVCKWLKDSILKSQKKLGYSDEPGLDVLDVLLLGAVGGNKQAAILLKEFPWYFDAGDGPFREIYYLTTAPAQYILGENWGHDSAQFVKIDGTNYNVLPQPFFRDNCVASLSNDTLTIVASADYVYFPFGEINNPHEIRSSVLSGLNVSSKVSEGNHYEMVSLDRDKVILCFDTIEEGVKVSYIVKGSINDDGFLLAYNIQVGMTKERFFETFFEECPSPLINKCHVFAIKSCFVDITHYYSFESNVLGSIKFVPDGVSPFKIDYSDFK